MSKGLVLPDDAIQSLNQGKVYTSCEPAQYLEGAAPGIMKVLMSKLGHTIPVTNESQTISLHVELTAVFVTTYGAPDAALLRGMGYSNAIADFQASYKKFWEERFPILKLDGSTALFVMTFEKTAPATQLH